MKQKRMKLVTKLIIYIIIFAIGGYFFFMYMPKGFKDMVTPNSPDTTAPAVITPDTTAPAVIAPDTTAPASPEVSPAL